METSVFNLNKFLLDVFAPQKTDKVVFLVDLPHPSCQDDDDWKERREMAFEWYQEMRRIADATSSIIFPPFYYPATGANSAPLPPEIVRLVETQATLVLAMTKFSATGPLGEIAKRDSLLRVASMPGILRRMEKSALAADYVEVQRRCKIVAGIMKDVQFCQVKFSTGHFCQFDLRHRKVDIDDGYLHADKQGDRVINLPSGEVYIAPYEGEIEGVESQTKGELPVKRAEVCETDGLVVFKVEGNRIVDVEGSGEAGDYYRKVFDEDDARRNIAECAFGVNPNAIVTGNVLEDEKAGFHWAYGLSSHLGGIWGPEKFKPETALHQDIVYAKDSPIQVISAMLLDQAGNATEVIRDGEYVIFENDFFYVDRSAGIF